MTNLSKRNEMFRDCLDSQGEKTRPHGSQMVMKTATERPPSWKPSPKRKRRVCRSKNKRRIQRSDYRTRLEAGLYQISAPTEVEAMTENHLGPWFVTTNHGPLTWICSQLFWLLPCFFSHHLDFRHAGKHIMPPTLFISDVTLWHQHTTSTFVLRFIILHIEQKQSSPWRLCRT